MPIVIYGLVCPRIGMVRYIGKASDPSKRLKQHLYSARSPKTHRDHWINSLLKEGAIPSIKVLEQVDPSQRWQAAEIKWIDSGIKQGWPLTNLAAGGNGGSPLNEAAMARKMAAMSSPRTRERMSLAAKARWADPEKRERGLAGLKSPERRKVQQEKAKLRATPEYRAMMSQRSKAAWSDKEKRARIVSGITPDVRKKVSEAAKRMWKTTDKAEVMLANLQSGNGR